MKSLSQLKIYHSAKTPAQVVATVLTILENPKRLLRGPRFSDKPSSGKLVAKENVSERKAVSACGNGLIDIVAKGGRRSTLALQVRDLLNETQKELFPGLQSHVTVSDTRGLRDYRKVLKRTLAKLTLTA